MQVHDLLQSHLRSLNLDTQFILKTSPHWGSQSPDHRAEIKSALLQNSELKYHSVSHCPEEGGFIQYSLPVGFDIEITARVLKNTVQRISSLQEMEDAPSPASLWCAKEATFKALQGFTQPSVVSKISIGGWSRISPQLETFELKNSGDFISHLKSYGVVIHKTHLTYAFFVIRS